MFSKVCALEVVDSHLPPDAEDGAVWLQRSSVECGKAVPVLLIKKLYLAKRLQYPESATSFIFLAKSGRL